MQPHAQTSVLTFYVLHDHAEVPARFEGAEHGHDKGILCKGENVSLHKGLLDLVPQGQVLLVNLLHGKSLPRLQVPHQVDSTGSHPNTPRDTWSLRISFSLLLCCLLKHMCEWEECSTHPYAPLLISLMVWKSASPGGFIALILPYASKITVQSLNMRTESCFCMLADHFYH